MTAPQDLIVVGGGEHARVVIEAALSIPEAWRLLGFADVLPCEETVARFGTRRLGTDEDCLRLVPRAQFVLGIGGLSDSATRGRVAARYDRAGATWATIVHTRAWVSPTARLGQGSVVLAGAVVNTGAVTGEHCIVNTGAVVEHDVRLGAYTHVGPGAVVGGSTIVGADSSLGLGCRVRDHLAIGKRVRVGMGAVVIRSVGDGETVVGVPAKSLARGQQ